MTIQELAAKYHVSTKLIRKMIRCGDLQAPSRGDLASGIRACLSRNQQLSVKQLLALIDNPRIVDELRNHKQRARDQVGELGYVRAAAAPPQVVACISDAATGDPESVVIMMRWIKSILPLGPVRYHWIAVRILITWRPILRRGDFGRVALAMQNVCAHPDFRGWWGTKQVGSQNPKIYYRPRLPFDL